MNGMQCSFVENVMTEKILKSVTTMVNASGVCLVKEVGMNAKTEKVHP